jgi:hypothetical protein
MKKIIKKIKDFFTYNDPLFSCELFKNEGCAHVDGIICNFPNCETLKEYKKKKYMKNFIPYDLYLKLKEKGFNPQKQPNYLYYNGELVEVKDHYNISPYEIAPTIEEVMKWLLTEKNIFIEITMSFNQFNYKILSSNKTDYNGEQKIIHDGVGGYDDINFCYIDALNTIIDNKLI